MKKCKYCGREFTPTHNAIKYCDTCRQRPDVLKGKAFDNEKPQICAHCGTEFIYQRKRKYCPECAETVYIEKAKAKRIDQTEVYGKICLICGKEYQTTISRQKYCGDSECKRKAKVIKSKGWDRTRKPIQSITYICKGCGIEFHPKAKQYDQYHSRECAFEHMAAKPKDPGIIINHCACGAIIKPNQKYCDECRKEKARYDSYLRTTAKPTKCRWCGKVFIPKYKAGTYTYCCQEHKELSGKECKREHKHGITNAKRKRIYLRDGCKCKLCGKPMRMDMIHTLGTSNPHPLAPTIDHIIPKSIARQQGWTKYQIHDDSNLQAAHWQCNIDKGVKPVGEQLLLFG